MEPGCNQNFVGKWRFKEIGKNLSACLANTQNWGQGSAVNILVESKSKATEAPAIFTYLRPGNGWFKIVLYQTSTPKQEIAASKNTITYRQLVEKSYFNNGLSYPNKNRKRQLFASTNWQCVDVKCLRAAPAKNAGRPG